VSNPWLKIPLDDYEGHMSLPAVGQAQMIAEQLDRSLERWAPTSIAVIGCALKTLKRNSRPNAVLTTILQLPHLTIHAVAPSPYKSLGSLASAMTFVAPETLRRAAADVGFGASDSTIIELSSGKRFCVQNFSA
jgi:hypothetical protein